METGRPLKFKTVEELEKAIDGYFKSREYETEEGIMSRPCTLSGLAYHIGFSDRASMYDYKKREEFSHTIKRARLYIESLYEEGLLGKSPAGCIFALKNLGWRDKTEVDNNHKFAGPAKITFGNNSTKEIK